MKKAKRFAVFGVGLGFCVALVLSGLAYALNSLHVSYNLDALYLTLAPTSLMLMATERASLVEQVIIVFTFALTNATLYGFIFFLLGLVWNLKRPK